MGDSLLTMGYIFLLVSAWLEGVLVVDDGPWLIEKTEHCGLLF
jgi:hypothetical protein